MPNEMEKKKIMMMLIQLLFGFRYCSRRGHRGWRRTSMLVKMTTLNWTSSIAVGAARRRCAGVSFHVQCQVVRA